jgi:nucleoside-diphosphate-sugar epimerase
MFSLEASMERVLVTGGTGFLGGWTARRLKALGHEVRVLGRNDSVGKKLVNDGIAFYKADLTELPKVREACEGIHTVIHCAALASPAGRYERFYKANVVGTANLLQCCRLNAISRFVYLSTPSLYFDYRNRLGIKESEPLPRRQYSNYGKTKLLAEQFVDEFAREGIPTISLRPRAIIGPGDQVILPRLIRAAERGPIPFVGGGRTFVDLTYVGNVVDAVLLAMHSGPETFGKKYNITNDEPMTVGEMADRLFKRIGKPYTVRSLPFIAAFGAAAMTESVYTIFKPNREPPLCRYSVGLMAKSQTLDITAAKTELHYTPNVSLDRAMDEFASWWNEPQFKV